MAMVKGPTPDVAERRLRPIYNLLENGSNKRAVAEVDKVLKRQPEFHPARPLKALALIRLGRASESSEILAELEAMTSTDDMVMSGLTMCYKELDQPEKIVAMLQSAAKQRPKDVELLSKLFMAAVRVHDFQLQQKIGMQMHKIQANNPYYFWTAMSIFMQGVSNPDAAQKLFFPLAEKMIQKFLKEGKIEADAEIRLLILILKTAEKYEDLYELLKSLQNFEVGNRLWLPEQLMHFEVMSCLNLLQRNEELFECAADYIKDTGDQNYRAYMFLVNSAITGGPEKIDRLFSEFDKIAERLSRPERSHAIASVMARVMTKRSANEVVAGLSNYMNDFEKLPCFFFDVRGMISEASDEVKEIFGNEVLPDWKIFESRELADLKSAQYAVNICQVKFLLRQNWKIEHYTEFARFLIQKYKYNSTIESHDAASSLTTELHTTLDNLVILAVDVMLTVQSETQHFNRDHLVQELLVIVNHCLAQYDRPMSQYLTFTASKLYASIGCASKMTALIEQLDTKYVQREALAYLYFDSLVPWGMPQHNLQMANIVLHTEEQALRDVADSTVTAYHRGQFEKAFEFYNFTTKMKNSLFRRICQVESALTAMITAEIPDFSLLWLPPEPAQLVNPLDFNVMVSFSGQTSGDCRESYIDLVLKANEFKSELILALALIRDAAGKNVGQGDTAILSERISALKTKFDAWKKVVDATKFTALSIDAPVLPPHDIFVNGSYFNLISFWLEVAQEVLVTGSFNQSEPESCPVGPPLITMFHTHAFRQANGDCEPGCGDFPYRQLCHVSYAAWTLGATLVVQELIQSLVKQGKKKEKKLQPELACLKSCAAMQTKSVESLLEQVKDLQYLLHTGSSPDSLLNLACVKEWCPQYIQTRDTSYGLALDQLTAVVQRIFARQNLILK